MTKLTVLSNGLKVASEKKFGPFCIVGLAIKSGSRYEVNYPQGLVHFIERSAFGPTKRFKSRADIAELMSLHGGTIDCQGSRETLVYGVSIFQKHAEHAANLLAETVLRPNLDNKVMSETATRINFENEDLVRDPERKMILSEMIHAAAYDCNTLGLPKLCQPESLKKIRPEIIYEYMRRNHTPDRMVLGGVGLEHEKLVEYAQKYFVDEPPIWEVDSNLSDETQRDISRLKSKYTGGCKMVTADLSNVSLGPTPLPNLAHLIIGFEASSHLDLDNFVIYCVMNMLLGGGGAFSSGGPGKGMYTRLFTNVLCQYYWVNSCSAQYQSYDDSGLFYIQASCPPEQLRSLVDVVIDEYKKISIKKVNTQELKRAKKQLISMLWFNLEERPVVFEDITRQVLSSGYRRHPKELIEKIESVNDNDIQRAAQELIQKTPSVCCLGDLRNMPSFDYIKNRLNVPEVSK